MSSDVRRQDPEPVSQLSLWFGLFGGAAAWAAHLVLAYALVPLACSQGLEILLYLTVPLTIAIALAAVLFSWRGWRRSRDYESRDENGDQVIHQRVGFMSLSGLVMSMFFLAIILAQTVPILTQSPCDPAGSLRI